VSQFFMAMVLGSNAP